MPSVEMSNLLSSNPARRLKEARLPVAAPDALGESDVEPIFGHARGGGASGSAVPPAAPPSDPMAAALIKLTTLVEDLHASKGSKGSRLEQALDGAITGGGGGEGSGVSARKNSVARGALRQALHESPEEIYQGIERLMLEDLMSTTLAPGVPRPPDLLCRPGRGWRTGAD